MPGLLFLLVKAFGHHLNALMFSSTTYASRRQLLHAQIDNGLILILGNDYSPMNYTDNVYHFRQDSNFLYFFGIDQAGMAGTIDAENGIATLYGDDVTVEDVVWTGPQTSRSTLAEQIGAEANAPFADLATAIQKAIAAGRSIHFLPPYRDANKIRLSEYLGKALNEIPAMASEALVRAVIQLRSYKTEEEIVEMEKAVTTTAAMHLQAMRMAQPGLVEANLTGAVHGIAVGGGGNLAYPIILTVNGQTLHNHHHDNILEKGQLVLGDFGAETASRYAGDVTRTFPVDSKFTEQQKAIYQIVLDAEVGAIEALKPGVPYRDIHLLAAKIITTGLQRLGLMKGDADVAVAAGAHALFFPHGLGHMIGLDVHDMEDLGEDLVGYDEEIQRSSQFGLNALRLGRRLEAGFVLTVEPGIYFIPELIDQWKAAGKFLDFINYPALEAYRNFGGIRIEDNCLITETGSRILGPAIPKTIEAVEAERV